MISAIDRCLYLEDLTADLDQPNFVLLIQRFVYDQENKDSEPQPNKPADFPMLYGKITPSNFSGIGGMQSERIHVVNLWQNGSARYDTIFVETGPDAAEMRGLDM